MCLFTFTVLTRFPRFRSLRVKYHLIKQETFCLYVRGLKIYIPKWAVIFFLKYIAKWRNNVVYTRKVRALTLTAHKDIPVGSENDIVIEWSLPAQSNLFVKLKKQWKLQFPISFRYLRNQRPKLSNQSTIPYNRSLVKSHFYKHSQSKQPIIIRHVIIYFPSLSEWCWCDSLTTRYLQKALFPFLFSPFSLSLSLFVLLCTIAMMVTEKVLLFISHNKSIISLLWLWQWQRRRRSIIWILWRSMKPGHASTRLVFLKCPG